MRHAGVNLFSDGRPVTGFSCPQLCEIIFSVSADCLVIPAHVWTPHFSVFGANSGFDSLAECYGKFTKQIFAVETGLSSDPAMNWRINQLSNLQIVSFSDAHSGVKLGREATVFQTKGSSNAKGEAGPSDEVGCREAPLSYREIANAIRGESDSSWKIAYTIEFYPEEGKYHYTAHRNCGIKQSPEETKKLGKICPVCGRQLAVGVMQRVEELASQPAKTKQEIRKAGVNFIFSAGSPRPPFVRLVPLIEILSDVFNSGSSSQNVINEYNKLIGKFGSEFSVLLEVPVSEIAMEAGERVAEGIKRVREGEIVVDPGGDGVFGKVRIWGENTNQEKPSQNQMSLF